MLRRRQVVVARRARMHSEPCMRCALASATVLLKHRCTPPARRLQAIRVPQSSGVLELTQWAVSQKIQFAGERAGCEV